MIETLEGGRDAVRRHAWTDAVEAFDAADRDGGLAPEDLELLGAAAWWAAEPDKATEALERAFAAYLETGRKLDAARVGIDLAYRAFRALSPAVGGGWAGRVQSLLAELPESGLHAWPLLFSALMSLERSAWDEGIRLAEQAMALAERHGNVDVLYQAKSFKGQALLLSGDWQAGMALIDEAAAAAVSGQLSLRSAGDIQCNTIAACRNVGDLERAAQWTDEGERWMRRQGLGGYPGICRVHRAELKMFRGEWADAEREAREACDELRRYRLLDALGFANYQIGQVRLRLGDLAGAEAAIDQAYEHGHDAQPGLAMLMLARGEIAEARRAIDRALAATVDASGGEARLVNRSTRGRLLPAQVDIALAAGDLETARKAVAELESIAATFERPLFRAGAMTARGEVLLGEEKAAEASPLLGQSWRLWQSTNLPYEAARARLHYAEALAAEGDEAMARRDFRAARSTFERLGAALDVQRIDALLGETTPTTSASERVTRTFMFTDIVTSTDLVGLVGDEAWTELLRWHDRELRAAVAQHGGEVVSHTGDGFFVAFERAVDAVEGAIEIQRRLARHRRDHGFAPWVRIGLHAAEASREDRNYIGRGVHVAARVGAAAGREEILVTADVAREAGPARFALSEPRSLTLKGVAEPVEVRAVDWR